MKRPRRLRQPRLLRRDWVGDGILTLLAGAALVVAVFLPWANEDKPGQVNYSFSMPDGINGVLQTQWGAPALVLALAVVASASRHADDAAPVLVAPRRARGVLRRRRRRRRQRRRLALGWGVPASACT